MSHTVILTLADLDTISAGGTVTATLPDVTLEVTSEDGWSASSDPAVIRFALDERDLQRLGWGRTCTALPVGFDGSVQFTVAAEVSR